MPWTTIHPPAHLAVPLIEAIYEDNAVGCCLHIVLDDNNIERSSVVFCRNRQEWLGEPICQRCDDCAKMLLLLSYTARKKAIAIFEMNECRRMHAGREARYAELEKRQVTHWVRLTCTGDATDK